MELGVPNVYFFLLWNTSLSWWPPTPHPPDLFQLQMVWDTKISINLAFALIFHISVVRGDESLAGLDNCC